MADVTDDFFTDAGLRNVLEELGGRCSKWQENESEAASKLNEILHQFLLTHLWEQQPPPFDSLRRLKAVKRIASNLRAALLPPDCPGLALDPRRDTFNRLASSASFCGDNLGGYPHHQPIKSAESGLPYYLGGEIVGSAVEYVRLIEVWATDAANRAGRHVGRTGKSRHKGGRAVQQLIADLVGLWAAYESRPPTYWATETGSSQFIGFVLLIRDRLLNRLDANDYATDASLRNSLNRLCKSTIREHVRRIFNPVRRNPRNRGRSVAR